METSLPSNSQLILMLSKGHINAALSETRLSDGEYATEEKAWLDGVKKKL